MLKTRGDDTNTDLPIKMRLRRRAFYIGSGVSGFFAGFALIVLLLSYRIDDPSLNTMGISYVQNLFGRGGAWLADLLVQFLGIGVWVLLPIIFIGSWHLIRAQGLSRARWRVLAAIGAGILIPLGVYWLAISAHPLLSAGALANLLATQIETRIIPLEFPRRAFGGLSLVLGAGTLLYSAALLSNTSAYIKRGTLFCTRSITDLIARQRAFRTAQSDQIIDNVSGSTNDSADEALQNIDVTASQSTKRGKRHARATTAEPDASTGKTPFKLPPLNILAAPRASGKAPVLSKEALTENAKFLENVLSDFGIHGTIGKIHPGPVVTLYELEPAPGIRTSRVIGLAEDIARSMSAIACRVAAIPGTNVIGIELPTAQRETVALRELLASSAFESHKSGLALALGKDIGGAAVITDLTKMPHLLVAGTTGAGKSVGINTMLLSLLYRLTPEQCRLIMIDPKMLELSVYDDIPHLLTPVVTESKKAVIALKWAVQEMENRYRKMARIGVRNMDGYNQRMGEAIQENRPLTREVQTGFDSESGDPIIEIEEIMPEKIPYIVIVIDEMADLMLIAGKEIEIVVQRLAQMARAAGIHLITATQRPSVDVITGTIKANFPSRISFQVTSKIDSRTVLGEQGGEQLLGRGDMLFMQGGGRIQRVHGPFVSDEEVEKVVAFLKKQGRPDYIESVTAEPEEQPSIDGSTADSLYQRAVDIVLRDQRASTSYLQRRLQIGYNKAAGLIENMETQGIISPPDHAGKRQILTDG